MGRAFRMRGSHRAGISRAADRRYWRRWRVCAAGKGKPPLSQQLAEPFAHPWNLCVSTRYVLGRAGTQSVMASREGHEPSYLGRGLGHACFAFDAVERVAQALISAQIINKVWLPKQNVHIVRPRVHSHSRFNNPNFQGKETGFIPSIRMTR